MITPAGRQVLNENPPKIDNLYLQRFESFRKFISQTIMKKTPPSTPVAKVSSKTPQDILDEAFQQINTTLADDLLSEIMKQPPTFFEHTFSFGTVFYTNASLSFTPIHTPITENKTHKDGVR